MSPSGRCTFEFPWHRPQALIASQQLNKAFEKNAPHIMNPSIGRPTRQSWQQEHMRRGVIEGSISCTLLARH